MNYRDLILGFTPTVEYERAHTYAALRQFPELRKSMNEIEKIGKSQNEYESAYGSFNPQIQSKGKPKNTILKSTRRLDELSKSSLDEFKVMSNFRKILLENRKQNQVNNILDSSSVTSESYCSKLAETSSIDALTAADEKLTKISLTHDAQSYNSHLAGFQGRKLNKHDFNTQLRRCLNINLKKVELDALFAKMDEDCSNLIDGVEFIRYFFRLGNEARWNMQMDTIQRIAKKEEDLKSRAREEENRIKEWENSQISNFGPEDMESAMEKLSQAASRWDPTNYIESLYINGFEAYLTPYQFKMQVDKSFGIHLTKAETGALIKEFSNREGDYPVDGHLFLKRFCALQKKMLEKENESKIVNKLRREKINQMGQSCDYLPKTLGR